MKTVLCAFLLSICIEASLVSSGCSEGARDAVTADLRTPTIIEIEPGGTVRASVLVSNHSSREEEFLEDVKLPSDWRVVTPQDPSLTLGAKEQEVRLLVFRVPSSCSAGRYEVTYSVTSKSDYSAMSVAAFSVVVSEEGNLQIVVVDSPEAVIAGEPYEASFTLVNNGNSKARVGLNAKAAPDQAVEIEPSTATFGPGESLALNLGVKTDSRLRQRTRYVITVEAHALDGTAGFASTEKTVWFDAIPRVTGEADVYHRLASEIRLIGRVEEGKGSFQSEFSGCGSLDETGTKKVGFLLRGPDTQDVGRFGRRDEFWAYYRDDLLSVAIGDRVYSLSPLTQRFFYGRGAELSVHPRNVALGGLYLETRWGEPKERRIGSYLGYSFGDKLRLKGNILLKRDGSGSEQEWGKDWIYSIDAEVRPYRTMSLGLEYGLSYTGDGNRVRGDAYRIESRGQVLNWMKYSFEKVHAGPDYSGYYRDSDQSFSSFAFPIYRRLTGDISYQSSESNLDPDSIDTDACSGSDLRAAVYYHFTRSTQASFEYGNSRTRDRILPASYDFTEETLRLGVGRTLPGFSVFGYVETGRLEDRLVPSEATAIERYNLSACLRPSDGQTYTLYGRIGNGRFGESPERERSAGISARWCLGNHADFNIDYMLSRTDGPHRRTRDDVFSTATCTLPNGHCLSLRGFFGQGCDENDDVSVSLAYGIRHGIPVGRKTGTGSLKGRVYDGEHAGKQPLPNVILVLNGASAVTRENGEFIFPAIKPGSYLLQIDQGSIGANRTAAQKLPIAVEMVGGKTAELEIAVVTAASIVGKVALSALETGNNPLALDAGAGYAAAVQGGLAGEGGVAGIQIQISDGNETLQQATDQNGAFRFDHIRPGKWILEVHERNLPEFYHPETRELEIDLKPGEEKQVPVRVLPVVRRVRIIDKGEIKP
jgi:hypothetical protein